MIDYDFYDDYDDTLRDRLAHRQAAMRPNHHPKRSNAEIVRALAARDDSLSFGFETTYVPARYEGEWLAEALGAFYIQGTITDILRLVKGGKEANVYQCAAPMTAGAAYIAAKVYRPRRFRNLRNDALYRHGRRALDADGKELRDERALRAIRAGTEAGKRLAHTSWLAHELATLRLLHEAGADVPEPLGSGSNAILMAYLGDEAGPATTLNHVSLPPAEVGPLFERVLWNVDLMLSLGRVHGDLSAYNVLYHEGRITLIDFPQAVNPYDNPDAEAIFRRDVTRIVEYFAGQGVEADADEIASGLWSRYVPVGLWDPVPEAEGGEDE